MNQAYLDGIKPSSLKQLIKPELAEFKNGRSTQERRYSDSWFLSMIGSTNGYDSHFTLRD